MAEASEHYLFVGNIPLEYDELLCRRELRAAGYPPLDECHLKVGRSGNDKFGIWKCFSEEDKENLLKADLRFIDQKLLIRLASNHGPSCVG